MFVLLILLKFADHHCLNFLFIIIKKDKNKEKDQAKQNKDKKAI